MKRIKRVFDNKQCLHVWAQQTQYDGRGNSVFFEGTKCFSYGRHYTLGEIHTIKGKRIAVLNCTRYSVTTAKHRNYAWSAVHGNYPIYNSPDPSDLNCTRNYAEAEIQFVIDAALKTRKVTSADEIKNVFRNIKEKQDKSNQLRKLLGYKEKFVPTKALDQVENHLKARLARYKELNTPEIIAKREAAKREKELAARAEAIAKFRSGETSYVWGLSHQLLRIQGEEVVTSSGARVPLSEARAMLRMMQDNPTKLLSVALNERIGEFRIDAIVPFGPDTEIKIGCHRILLSEARAVLGTKLEVIQGGAA